MRFDEVNLENWNSFILQKYRISDNILKVCPLVKRMSYHLIKLDRNYRSCYLRGLTVELYFSLYIFSNELLVQKFSEFLIDLECLPKKNITRRLYYLYNNYSKFYPILLNDD